MAFQRAGRDGIKNLVLIDFGSVQTHPPPSTAVDDGRTPSNAVDDETLERSPPHSHACERGDGLKNLALLDLSSI